MRPTKKGIVNDLDLAIVTLLKLPFGGEVLLLTTDLVTRETRGTTSVTHVTAISAIREGGAIIGILETLETSAIRATAAIARRATTVTTVRVMPRHTTAAEEETETSTGAILAEATRAITAGTGTLVAGVADTAKTLVDQAVVGTAAVTASSSDSEGATHHETMMLEGVLQEVLLSHQRAQAAVARPQRSREAARGQ